jgi:bifunctional ADP-heptose synthase (sugar kinase/adenylyltransferase)
MALALAAGASLLIAATRANHAAGISVSKFRPATVSSGSCTQPFEMG